MKKIELAKFLFQQEAKRIKKNLNVRIDVFTALMTADNYGNVGELKSQVQLTCAQAFLNSIDATEVTIELNDLPEDLRKHWLSNPAKTRHQVELSRYLDTNTLFEVGKKTVTVEKRQYL